MTAETGDEPLSDRVFASPDRFAGTSAWSDAPATSVSGSTPGADLETPSDLTPRMAASETPAEGLALIGSGRGTGEDTAADESSLWAGQQPLSHSEIRVIVVGILLAMFLSAIDQTIVATALPTIGRLLGDSTNPSWVVSAYLLTATAVTPLYGKLSDMYGVRRVMLIGIAIFVVGSVACAVAPTMLALILARGLQGIGAGGLLPVAQTVIGSIVLPKERGRYQAVIAGMWSLASIMGPILGGLLTEYLHWSFIFWINLPLGVVAYVISSRTLKRLPIVRRHHRLDVVGSLLMMVAAVALMVALTSGGEHYPWLSTPIVALVSLSLVFWVAFAVRLGTAQEPFVPPSILANQVVRTGTFGVSCNVATIIGLTIFIPFYFGAVHGLSISLSALALIPMMVLTNVGSVISGRGLAWFKHYKRVPIVGLSLAVMALVMLAFHPLGHAMIYVIPCLCLIGVGVGTVYPVTTVSVQNAVPRHHLGIATGTMNFFRSLISSIFVAVLGAIVLGGTNIHTARETGLAGTTLTDVDGVFRTLFLTCAGFLCVSIFWLVRMHELPLAGRADFAPQTAAKHAEQR